MLDGVFWQNVCSIFTYDKANPMLFNSGAFMLAFALFITVYSFVYKNKTSRTFYILAFSFFFYYKASGFYYLILLLSVVIDFFVALILYEIKNKKYRVIFLIFSIAANLGLLFYFKYTNFILENITNIMGGKFTSLDIFLPIGISFYTFQTISYVVDVYRGDFKPTKNFVDYAFYMTFFPHLVAGPIVRAKFFLPQNDAEIKLLPEDLSKGLFLILKGLIKKAIIADYIAQYCDIVYSMPGSYSGFENLIAMYGYTFQIYFDFSGYSDMAIGLALLMGFKLNENFNSPYIAFNITDFWRRWHMSLSTWLRDYLYISLGGSRKGKIRTNINLLLTMLIGGFWHGASWKFVFWGGLHGIGLIVHKMFLLLKPTKFTNSIYMKVIGWFITFHFVAILWVYFRAESFTAATDSLSQIFTNMDWAYLPPFISVRALFCVVLMIGVATHFIPLKVKEFSLSVFTNMHFLFKALAFLVVIQLIIQLQSENVQPFIYFQF